MAESRSKNEPVEVSDFDPGEGWRELENNEAANGREFVMHGYLKHPLWSFHTTRTWVRSDQDEVDDE